MHHPVNLRKLARGQMKKPGAVVLHPLQEKKTNSFRILVRESENNVEHIGSRCAPSGIFWGRQNLQLFKWLEIKLICGTKNIMLFVGSKLLWSHCFLTYTCFYICSKDLTLEHQSDSNAVQRISGDTKLQFSPQL